MSTQPVGAGLLFDVCRDADGTYYIGQAVKRRFLWWRWTVWVNVAKWPGTDLFVSFRTYAEARAHFDDMRDRGLFNRA